jgi:hypothetical protein
MTGNQGRPKWVFERGANLSIRAPCGPRTIAMLAARFSSRIECCILRNGFFVDLDDLAMMVKLRYNRAVECASNRRKIW